MDYMESTRVVEKFSDGEFGTGELTEENLDLQMDANIQMELIRGRNLLQKIQQEQAAVDASIIACRQQILELHDNSLERVKVSALTTVRTPTLTVGQRCADGVGPVGH